MEKTVHKQAINIKNLIQNNCTLNMKILPKNSEKRTATQ
jgi:hypothetical protein